MMRRALVLSMVVLLAGTVWAEKYGGGSGTAEDPYQIRTAEHLNTIGLNPEDWGSHFKLINDIYYMSESSFESTDGFINRESITRHNIIGNSRENPFSGTFDGSGHVIKYLNHDQREAADYVGLFGCTSSTANIRNVGLEGVYFSSYYGHSVGALVGYNTGMISGCYMIGTVVGLNRIGGLAGENWPPGTITACYAAGAVVGADDVGGLVGLNRAAIQTCYASGSVRGESAIGGLVGRNYQSVTNSYATGWVGGELFWTGGLTGWNSGSVTNCYAAGAVYGGHFASGGLTGWNSGSVSNCCSTGTVSGSSYVGGFAGENYSNGAFSGCFWDTQTSEITDGVGSGASTGLTGKTTPQMYMINTFANAGWDLSAESPGGIWRMCVDAFDYPRLRWEFSAKGDLECRDGVALEDILYLAERWLWGDCGEYNYCDWADINRDGIVNFKDLTSLADNWLDRKPPHIDWVTVQYWEWDWASVEMSIYLTTNAQYARYLNSALKSGHIGFDMYFNYVKGVRGLYSGQNYYQLYGPGHTGFGATNGGKSRINYIDGQFTVESGFENHPVTYVSWYGATAFADYYRWRLPQKYEWQEVARYTDNRVYATGSSLYDAEKFLANYRANGSDATTPNNRPYHPWVEHGTSEVGYFGTFGYGLADMAGNVREWTSTGSPGYSEILGGSWDSASSPCTIWFQASAFADSMTYNQGFRVCR